ncbi:D-alanyl-D-alanine carboxypeptidase [Halobacteriovorax sp. YZS-1-1]|uniref:D-alanyl-D-alanine carboxypeptidase n=1 Tax=unclassified Halobacteriovorax TaxID=2639665 RepID=UPI00399BA2B1
MIKILLLALALNTSANTIKDLEKEFLQKGDTLSYYIADENGKVISSNENQNLIPASIFKIFSAYYILDKLGTDFHFSTSISYRGDIENGTLKGDLILNTSGDPYLLTPQIFDLIESVAQEGIKKVDGNLVVVNNFVNIERIGTVGLDDQPYNQSISGFNLNFNRFKSIGRSTQKSIFPKHDGFQTISSQKSLGPGVGFKNQNKKSQDIEKWQYTKTKDYFVEVPIRNSLAFNAYYLKKQLEQRGISISGIKITNKEQSETKRLNTIKSPSSLDLVKLAMEYSNNLFIETLTLKATNKENLADAAKKMIKDLKIKTKGKIENSSGLTTETRITPKEIVNFIQENANQKFGSHYFINLLSITGHSGSLHRKYLNDDGFEKFRYKTGSIDYVYNICGQSFEKTKRTFCIMINNLQKRKLVDGKNTNKTERLREEAKGWRRAKERFSELLLLQM